MLKQIVTIAAIAAGGAIIAKQIRQKQERGMMTVQEWIEVDVPVSTAYNQWTQFEAFPQFMNSVHEIRQLDDRRLHWRADICGKTKEWDVEITEQIPDERIAWRSKTGAHNAGVVTFHHISDNRTRIMLQMDYEPETVIEYIGDALGSMRFEAKRSLKNFKQFIEGRDRETGEWRGTVARQH